MWKHNFSIFLIIAANCFLCYPKQPFMIGKRLSAIGAFSMALAVVLGALGAHALKELLPPEKLTSFITGNKYQIYHSLALLFLPLLEKYVSPKAIKLVGLFFLSGIVLFSFSIYLLSTKSLLGLEGLNWLGPITPIGGLLLISGWVILGIKLIINSKIK